MVYAPVEGVKHWYLAGLGMYFPVHDGASFGKLLFEGFKAFITFAILFNNLVPISLYVSLEVAKLIQGSNIANDLDMYHEETDTPAVV